MSGVLVFGDVVEGVLSPTSFEAAAAGAQLAKALGEPLSGALVGPELGPLSEQFRCDFDVLYLVEGEGYRPYTASAAIAAAHAVLKAASPSIVLFAQTLETREWVPRLAARMDTGLVTDCIGLSVEGGALLATKPVYGGSVLGQFVIHGSPKLATVRPGAFEARSGAPAATVRRLDVACPKPANVTLVDEIKSEGGGGLRLKDAKVIVAGGRGIGGQDNWHFIEETAGALGAAVGCSRPVADSGWVPSSHQVGLSGASVKPALYLAVGISGAVQHLAGISNSSVVVAVNPDGDADIFTRASFGVVGDYREVLPAFIERVRQLRS